MRRFGYPPVTRRPPTRNLEPRGPARRESIREPRCRRTSGPSTHVRREARLRRRWTARRPRRPDHRGDRSRRRRRAGHRHHWWSPSRRVRRHRARRSHRRVTTVPGYALDRTLQLWRLGPLSAGVLRCTRVLRAPRHACGRRRSGGRAGAAPAKARRSPVPSNPRPRWCSVWRWWRAAISGQELTPGALAALRPGHRWGGSLVPVRPLRAWPSMLGAEGPDAVEVEPGHGEGE